MVGLDDVGMDEVGHEAGLANEVVLKLLNGGILFANQLYGYDLAKVSGAELHGLIDQAHPSLRDFAGHLIVELVEDVLNGRHGEGQKGGPA
jgi:hypothetical protein